MSSLKERKIAKKKQEILRSAAEVFVEKGFEGTTMEEIAAKLLMTKGSMYYYFKNKEELLYHCHKTIMEVSIEKLKEISLKNISPSKKLEEAIKSHIKLAATEKSMIMAMNKPGQYFSGENLEEIVQSRDEYASYFDKFIAEGVESGEFHPVNVKIVRMIILGAMNRIPEWFKSEGELSIDEIADLYAEYLLRMVLKEQQ